MSPNANRVERTAILPYQIPVLCFYCRFLVKYWTLAYVQTSLIPNFWSNMILGSPDTVKGLAQSLEKDVQTLTQYLDSAGQPAPSFDLHSPTVVLPENAPSHAHEARERILDHCLQLFQLVAGPSEYLANLQTGVCFLCSYPEILY